GWWSARPRSSGARSASVRSCRSPRPPTSSSPATTATAAPGSSDADPEPVSAWLVRDSHARVTPERRRLALAEDGEAVGEGEERGVDAVVGGDQVVERTHGDDRLVVRLRVDDATALERVVDQDHAVRAQPGDDLLVVDGVRGLVGVDERQVELLL